MTPEEVIVDRAPGGFTPNARLLGLWRGAGAVQALPPRLTLADRSGRPTPVFLGVFRGAFSHGLQPTDAIVTRDGKPTESFLTAAREVGL